MGTYNSEGGAHFTVTMNEEANDIVGAYDYTIRADAEGGAFEDATGQMVIETPVGSTLLSLTGYPDCDGVSCTFYSSYNNF